MPIRSFFTALLLTASLPAAGSAQQLSLMAGRAEYDLSGVHTSNVWSVRLAVPAAPFLLVEPALGYIHTRQSFGRSRLWMPEVQAQAQIVRGAFAPYLGVGAGVAVDDAALDALETEVDFTTSAAAGVRIRLLDQVGIRVEGRVRGVELDWTGTVSELTAGVVIGG